MIEIPVYNMQGTQTGTESLDPDQFGKRIRPRLIKQAVVAFQTHQRQGSARTKSRSMVEGSTRKLYRQKGTGNARMGTIRTCIRRGGGVAFAKGWRNYDMAMPKKMRRLARNSAILAKAQSNDILIIEDLAFEAPKTKRFADMLAAVGATQGCLLAMEGPDDAVYRSGRNIPKTEIRLVEQLNAYEILRRRTLILSKGAFEALRGDPEKLRSAVPGETGS